MASASNAVMLAEPLIEFDCEEQRKTPRVTVTLRARVRVSNGAILDAITADISRAGMGFFAPHTLPEDQHCCLFVDLSACGTAMELKLAGRVCYCVEQSPGRFRVGLQFAGLEAEAAELLDAMLE